MLYHYQLSLYRQGLASVFAAIRPPLRIMTETPVLLLSCAFNADTLVFRIVRMLKDPLEIRWEMLDSCTWPFPLQQ